MTARQLQPCGTRGAYQRHLRAGEPPCVPCSAANARDKASRDQRRPSRDIDEIAVERAIRGEMPDHLTIAECEEVVRRLYRRNLPDVRIAEHLDISFHGVRRIRVRLGLPAISGLRRYAA